MVERNDWQLWWPTQVPNTPGGGGTHIALDGSTGMYRPQDPLFRPIFLPRDFLAPETHYFKPFSSFRDPDFFSLFFEKKSYIFKTNFRWFWVNISSYLHKLKFVPETPVSRAAPPQKKNSGDPSFENLGGTYQPKICSTTSPGRVHRWTGNRYYRWPRIGYHDRKWGCNSRHILIW